jgi:TetR/AcrR family transcriptional repressor of nem operon
MVYILLMHHKHATEQPSRGRPREFDPKHVTRSAMGVFWSNGYCGTSLPDLLEATKLSRSSLYAAYGDKHGLFLNALDQFIEDSLVRIDNDLAPIRPALEGLRACLAGCVRRSAGASGKRGCLLVATAVEKAGHDPEVGKRVRKFFDGFEKRLAVSLTRARAENALADGVDPSDVARILLSVMEGLRVVGKTGIDEKAWLVTVNALIDRFQK